MFTNFQIPSRKLGQARKKSKLNPQLLKQKNISQFDTELPLENQPNTSSKTASKPDQQYSIPIEQQRKRNNNLLGQLLSRPQAQSSFHPSAPTPSPEPPTSTTPTPRPPKPTPTASQNWKQFLLLQSTPTPSSKSPTKKTSSSYLALDCEFVQCVDGQQIARISIVSEEGQELFDSYIRPESRILDYRTEFSGVTFGHLRKAPTWASVQRDVKKILWNKVLVGHTVWKDLEVMGMTDWKGAKSIVDISSYTQYKEGGKVQGLKKLTSVFLGKDIQIGKHSSLQDAKATMELFKLRKDKILAEIERTNKFIKKGEAHNKALKKKEQEHD